MQKFLDLEAHTGIDIPTVLGRGRKPLEDATKDLEKTGQPQERADQDSENC